MIHMGRTRSDAKLSKLIALPLIPRLIRFRGNGSHVFVEDCLGVGAHELFVGFDAGRCSHDDGSS